MRTLLLIFLFTNLTSCYVYKPIEKQSTKKVVSKKKKKPLKLIDAFKELKAKEYYKIETVNNKTYKITFVSQTEELITGYIRGKEKKEITFNKQDVLVVRNRNFSQIKTDTLTISIYAIIGAAVASLFL